MSGVAVSIDRKPALAGRGSPRFALALGAIVLAGLALRCLRLGDGLWMDEGISVTFVMQAHGIGDLLRALATTDQSERLQQLYVVLLYGWCGLFGESTLSLRLFSLLPGIATVLVLARAGWRLHGPPGALWAASLASGSAFLTYFSAEIRASAFLILFFAVFLAGWIADRQVRGPRIGTLAACVIAATLLCLGSIYGFFPLAAVGIADTRWFRAPRRWLGFWLTVAVLCSLVFLALYAPVLLQGNIRAFAGVMQSQGLLQNVLFVIYGITVGQTFGPPLEALHGADRGRVILGYAPLLVAYAAVMAALGVAILGRVRRARPSGQRTGDLVAALAGALLLALAIGATAGWVQDINWLPRHAFYLAPLFVLVLAGTLADPEARLWQHAAACALVLLNLVAIYHANFKQAYALDDYVGVARLLSAPPYQGTAPVLLSGHLELLRDYYGVSALADGRQIRPDTLDRQMPDAAGGARDVTVVLNREFYWTRGLDAALPSVYSGDYAVSDHRHLVYFDLYRLTRK